MSVRRWTAIALGLCLLSPAGCEPDVVLGAVRKQPTEDFALIKVEPRALDFGAQKTNAEVAPQTVTISNVGYLPLNVSAIELVSGEGTFTLDLGTELPLELESGTPVEVGVIFHPEAGAESTGRMIVRSDSRDEPEVGVDLAGNGLTPALLIEPAVVDFGDAFIPCDKLASFTLTNVGSEPLDITSIRFEADSGDLTIPTTLPPTLRLYEGQKQTFPVRLIASEPGPTSGRIIVQSNDPEGEQSAEAKGNRTWAPTLTETFEVPAKLPVNIMLAVDQSCSMSGEFPTVQSEVSKLATTLANAKADWKIGVLTDGSGCFKSPNASGAGEGWLSSSVSGWQTKLGQAIAAGGADRETEALLQATANAIDKQTGRQCDASFRDAGAPLQIILVSDERDQSQCGGVNCYASNPSYWATFVTRYQAYAGAATVRVHAIVDVDSKCGSDPKGPGGYRDAAYATGGRVLDVCGAWAANFADIADQVIADLGRFQLRPSVPIQQETLVLEVDGEVQVRGTQAEVEAGTADYWLDSTNGVQFDPPLEGGSVVEASYSRVVTCR